MSSVRKQKTLKIGKVYTKLNQNIVQHFNVFHSSRFDFIDTHYILKKYDIIY